MFTLRFCFHSLRLIDKSEIIKIAYKNNRWIFTPLHISTFTGTEKILLNHLFQGPL